MPSIMHHLNMLVYISVFLFLSLSTLTSAATCSGVVGIVASVVAGFPEAQKFCSSKFPAPTSTVTAPTVTATTTVATSTATTTIATVTQTTTVATTISTVTVTINTITTTVSTTTLLTTITNTETDTVTVTTTVNSNKKRGLLAVRASTTNAQNAKSAALGSLISTASTVASSICRCLQPTKTTTTTPTTTKSVTATVTTSVTLIVQSSVTATVITTKSDTLTVPVVATTIVTTTTTTTTTTTVSATVFYTGPPQCNNPNGNAGGGCSGNCYCDSSPSAPAGTGYCDGGVYFCPARCASNADCAANEICSSDPTIVNSCGGPTCSDYSGCTSTFVVQSKRSLFARGDTFGLFSGEKRHGRMSVSRSASDTIHKEVKNGEVTYIYGSL